MSSKQRNKNVNSSHLNVDTTAKKSNVLVKNKRWKSKVIIVASVIVTLPILWYGWLLISLSGGIGGIIHDLTPMPDPESGGVVSKRSATKSSIKNAFVKLDNKTGLGFKNYAESTHDSCYKGQNNWEVHDGYAHRCTYRITRFYGFNGDFREQMIGFEQKLFGDGWRPSYVSGYPLKEIMENYYDAYYGDKDSKVSQNFGGSYLVSDLPTPTSGYVKGRGLLQMEYAEKATKNLFEIEYAQNVSGGTLFETYDKKDFQNINSVFQKVTQDNAFLLTLSIQEDYFQN